jgi:hypothetical protein
VQATKAKPKRSAQLAPASERASLQSDKTRAAARRGR